MAHASPASAASVPSPQMDEEKRYAEKLQQLSRFITPLQNMIERIEQDTVGHNKNEELKKEVLKIKRLLDIISNPHSIGKEKIQVRMDLLLRCEQVLEKMDFKQRPVGTAVSDHQPTHVQQPVPQNISSNICQPLLDAITANIKKPHFQSTLARTFSPAAAALGIIPTNSTTSSQKSESLIQDDKLIKSESISEEISCKSVLEGEIARLDPKFKVEEDLLSHPASDSTQLVINLDSLDLPYVPAIVVRVPSSYPTSPPVFLPENSSNYSVGEDDSFFCRIDSLFRNNCQRLPCPHSLTSLLQTWEQSVRQACSASLLSV